MTGRAAVIAVLVAVALAGCGGGSLSKSEYEQKVRAVYADVQRAFRATDVPLERLAARVAAAQRQLRDAADDLDSVEPPGDVADEHGRIVTGLREYADDVEELRVAAVNRDQAAIDAFNASLPRNRAVMKIAEAAEEMRFKGYDLGPIAED